MPRRSPTIKKYLSQLKKKELLNLANKKKLRNIPEKWSRAKIVDALSLYVTVSDVTGLMSKPSKAKTTEGKGYEARERGAKLEQKIANTLRNRGYKCKTNVRTKGAEFDVIAKKEGGWLSSDEWIFAECKNKPKVVPSDFKKFVGNFRIFCRKRKLDEEEVEGVLYTTGIFDPLVRTQARDFPRRHKPSKFFYHIKNQFKRFLEDIELHLAQEQTQIDNWINQQRKTQADQFFNSSFYQSIKDVHVPIHNAVKETTHDMGSKNWLQKMTENMTRLDFIEDSDVYEKLNKLKKHPLYYEFS